MRHTKASLLHNKSGFCMEVQTGRCACCFSSFSYYAWMENFCGADTAAVKAE